MRKILLAISLLFLASTVFAVSPSRGVSPAVKYENNPNFVEAYRIKIENSAGGTIEVSEDEGVSWKPIGKVLQPSEKINSNGFAAAAWIGEGRIAATAVNAIHVKVGPKDKSSSIFSILPKNFVSSPANYRSYLSPNSSIYVNIAAGEAIFGGEWAPYVGNMVMLSRPGTAVIPLPPAYIPQLGDKIFIIVDRPADFPKEMVFENRFGGKISLKYFSGAEKVVGEVLRPVSGIGRFEGSEFADPGRIRANHPGVIDISVAPPGKIGGFQIVPSQHGSNLGYVLSNTQWMVIGPTQVGDFSLEGIAPFFRYFLKPANVQISEEDVAWSKKMAERFLVEVKLRGKAGWQTMPILALEKNRPLPAWANSALENVEAIKIIFPVII